METNNVLAICKCEYQFIKKNQIRREFYLRHCLLLTKLKFSTGLANKTCLTPFHAVVVLTSTAY